jgi:hypothetical protein
MYLPARSRPRRRQVSPQSNQQGFAPLYRASSLHRGQRIYRPAAHASSTSSKCACFRSERRRHRRRSKFQDLAKGGRIRLIRGVECDIVFIHSEVLDMASSGRKSVVTSHTCLVSYTACMGEDVLVVTSKGLLSQWCGLRRLTE